MHCVGRGSVNIIVNTIVRGACSYRCLTKLMAPRCHVHVGAHKPGQNVELMSTQACRPKRYEDYQHHAYFGLGFARNDPSTCTY